MSSRASLTLNIIQAKHSVTESRSSGDIFISGVRRGGGSREGNRKVGGVGGKLGEYKHTGAKGKLQDWRGRKVAVGSVPH